MQGKAHASGPGNTERPLPVFAYFQNGDIYHDLGARLVQIIDHLLRQQQLIWRTADNERVLAGNTVNLDPGKDIANGSLHIVQIVLLPGVAQIEGLQSDFIQFGALWRLFWATKIVFSLIGRQKVLDMVPTTRSAFSNEELFRST